MNLLRDPWIAVKKNSAVELVTLEDLLCHENSYKLSVPRDDFEMGMLQLIICLTQVVFLPESISELKERLASPMAANEYQQRSEVFLDWFDLQHVKHPFMQTKNVKANDITLIQKLLPGLPAGNNHIFFNGVGEINNLSAAMCAVALFQQATSAPGFGGGFKNSLRGAAPLSTIIWDDDLRKQTWNNILTKEAVLEILPWFSPGSDSELPTWINPIQEDNQVSKVGLARGLFWQPSKLELQWSTTKNKCDLLGVEDQMTASKFIKEKFTYEFDGQWPHPHSPKDEQGKIACFRTQVPAWTQSHNYVYQNEVLEKDGHQPAQVVNQIKQLKKGQPLVLQIGGYCNNQANIIERRHEMLTIGADWESTDLNRLKKIVEIAQEAKSVLKKTLYGLKKGDPKKKMKGIGVNLSNEAEALFYQLTEGILHDCLSKFTFAEFKELKQSLIFSLREVVLAIYDQLTMQFQHDPAMIALIVVRRKNLQIQFNKLFSEASV